MRARTPREIIDQAIEENRPGERLLYVLSGAFAVVGLFVLVWATLNRMQLTAVVGGLSSALFWPAANFARQIRKESIAIRLLEAPLSRGDTAREAAHMIQILFNQLMIRKEAGVESLEQQPVRK